MTTKFVSYKQTDYNKLIYSILGNLVFTYCLIIAVALIIVSACTIECDVIGTSMQPNLNVKGGNKNDVVYVNKYNHDYNYGDIVVIDTDSEPIIKRVIGLPGDIIDFVTIDGIYYVERNGEALQEDYIMINDNISTPTAFQNGIHRTYSRFVELKGNKPELFNSDGKLIVGENKLFVLGDNRQVSMDSAYYGTFDFDDIEGIVEMIRYYGDSEFEFYWYYVLEGKFFNTLFNAF